MRRLSVLLVVAIAASLTAALPVARAAAPVHEWVPIDETFPFDGCGFPLVERDQLKLHFVNWYDASGTRTRQLVAAPGARITYTNPLTGESVTAVNPFVVHKTDNPDGSTTIAFTGLVFAINTGGHAYVTSGRALIVFDDGTVTQIAEAGPTADLCEALTAAIG